MKGPSLSRQKLILRMAFLIIMLVSALAFYSTQRLIAAGQRVEQIQTLLIETNRFLRRCSSFSQVRKGQIMAEVPSTAGIGRHGAERRRGDDPGKSHGGQGRCGDRAG